MERRRTGENDSGKGGKGMERGRKPGENVKAWKLILTHIFEELAYMLEQ